ncbi:MAG: putative sugar O-methyltransferase [Eubacteriales bacterium]
MEININDGQNKKKQAKDLIKQELIKDEPETIRPNLKLGRPIISYHAGERFDINGDFQTFERIIEDMHLNGEELAPSGVWSEYSLNKSLDLDNKRNTDEGYIYNIFLSKFSTMKLIMDPWIGQVGMQPVTNEQIKQYQPLLNSIDLCGLVGDDLLETALKQNMLNTDLGSIVDVNLITNILPLRPLEKYCILEIGGGYGRLAEAFSNGTDSRLHYVIVDAVPASLLYAKEYLEKAFPNKRIGFYLNDIYDMAYDFFISTPWHMGHISNTEFDICINVESMQEMEQKHVDFYLKNFDELVKEDGHIYISNSRVYHFKGPWNFPDNWKLIICHNTPRSWSNDHPTMMFKKVKGNWNAYNQMIEGLHIQQIEDWDLKLEVASLRNELAWRNDELNILREKCSNFNEL